MDSTFSTKAKVIFGLILALKILLLALFSSAYRDTLFVPFVLQFLDQGGNPWDTTLINDAFPYPPLMLYILSAFLAPLKLLGTSHIVESIFYGLPLILSDLLITYILLRMFPWRKTEIFIFYFICPIILFSTYMHGQLDIIPTAFLFAGVYLLTKKQYLYSALIIGLAASTKLHTSAIIPLIILYLINQGRFKESVYFVLIPLGIYLGFSLPYLNSTGYQELVLYNQKQMQLLDSFIPIGNAQLVLPILFVTAIYLRFAVYRKINADLLYAAIGALYSVFLLSTEPSPGWFVWMVPFFTIFYIRYFGGFQHYLFYAALTFFYLIYYLVFHQYDYPHLLLAGTALFTNIPDSISTYGNVFFTAMEAVLLGTVYQFYRNAIKSNEVYTMEQAFVLGIGGDSGAGKTTLTQYLKDMFGDQLLELEGDGDHKWERGDTNWQDYTHLDPKANQLHQQAEQVVMLKNRIPIKRADYNHNTGKFTEADRIKPRDFIVIAGLHSFYLPKMRKVIDLKIFLDLDERLRTSWKIQRDQQERGYSVDEVLAALADREEDSELYIRPQKQFSDFCIRFFPAEEERFDGQIYQGKLGLEVAVDASIELDSIINALKASGVRLMRDYSPDLTTQFVRFNEEPPFLDIEQYANQHITNHSELVDTRVWKQGYAGLIQILILMAISEVMQDRAQIHD